MTTYEKYKISLMTLFVLGFLFCIYNYSQNNRCIFSNNSELVLNTKTGTVFGIEKGLKRSIDDYTLIKKK